MFVAHKKSMPRHLYNILFPVWMLVWFPTWLWLILIPANYVIDYLVLRLAVSRYCPEDKDIVLPASWRVCLIGFFADFVGAIICLVAMVVFTHLEASGEVFGEIAAALGSNAFMHPVALVIMIVAIGVAGLIIFLLDRRLLENTFGLELDEARKVALLLSTFTAPYLFLLPTSLFYR